MSSLRIRASLKVICVTKLNLSHRVKIWLKVNALRKALNNTKSTEWNKVFRPKTSDEHSRCQHCKLLLLISWQHLILAQLGMALTRVCLMTRTIMTCMLPLNVLLGLGDSMPLTLPSITGARSQRGLLVLLSEHCLMKTFINLMWVFTSKGKTLLSAGIRSTWKNFGTLLTIKMRK